MHYDVQTVFERLISDPKAKIPIGSGTHLIAEFKRSEGHGPANWYIIIRAVNNATGDWIAASASPMNMAKSKGSCLRAALFALKDGSR